MLPQLLVTPGEGRIERANPSACALLSVPAADLEGAPLPELFPEASAETSAFLDRAVQERSAWMRARWTDARGGDSMLGLHGTALAGDGQSWVHVGLQDVSAAEELKVARGFQESLFNHFPEAAFLKDREGVYEAVSPQFLRGIGKDLDEVLGARDPDLSPKEIADRCVATDRQVLEEASPRTMERWVRNGAGEWSLMEVLKLPHHDADGRLRGVIGLGRDVTERNQAERTADQLADILEVFPGPAGMCDPDLKVLYHNQYARELLGAYSPGVTPAGTFFPERTLHEVLEREAIPAATRDGEWTGEVQLLDKEGKERPFLLTLVAHYGEEEEVERFSAIGVELAGQKEAEAREKQYVDQLNRVSRLISMGELVSILSHQLNQPLTALTNYAAAGRQLLSGEDRETGQWNGLLESMDSEARKAAGILAQIRNFLKGHGPEFQPVYINGLIQEIFPFICTGCSGERPTVNLELAEDLPPVRADRIQLQEAIFNLARNGVESCVERNPEKPGPLILRTRRSREGVEVLVVDHGSGLPSGLDLQALEPFFSTKDKGLGLGLWITRSIVQAHGGQLGAWDHGEEPGATFRITLPAQ